MDTETLRILIRVIADPDTPEDRDRAWAGVEETVEGLRRERDEARKERDRLKVILAVERGDEGQAPEGWVRHERWGEDWLWGAVSVRPVEVRNRMTGARTARVWVAYGPGRKVGPQRDTALECMEAVVAEEAAGAARKAAP